MLIFPGFCELMRVYVGSQCDYLLVACRLVLKELAVLLFVRRHLVSIEWSSIDALRSSSLGAMYYFDIHSHMSISCLFYTP